MFYSIFDEIILSRNLRFPSKLQLILQLCLVLKIRLYTLFLLLFFLSFQFLFYWALHPFERHFVLRLHTLSSLGYRPMRSNESGYYQIRPFHLQSRDFPRVILCLNSRTRTKSECNALSIFHSNGWHPRQL